MAAPTNRGTDNTIGERIVRARVARRMSAAELARMIGRSESTLSGYENGTVEIYARMLVNIARSLGTTVAALVGEAPDPNVNLSSTPHLIAGIDISDLSEHDRVEISGLVAYMAALRRQRRANNDGPPPTRLHRD